TDADGQYIEVQSGRLLTQGDTWIFEPLLVEEWTEWWYPIKNMGGFVKANPEAAVNLDVRDDRISAALNTTGSVQGGRLRIYHENEVVFSEEVSISPDMSYRRTIPHKKKPGEYILEWADAKDRPIIRTTTEKPDIPEPVLQPDFSSARDSGAEIEYLRGYYALKHWNTEAAIGFFKKALSIDPDHTNAMTQLGIQYYKTGLTEEALKLLNGVLGRQEDEYTARYYRALAQYRLGITGRTAEDLHLVGRRAAFRHVAPTILAGLAMRAGRADEAEVFLSQALNTNPDDLKSMALLAALCRHRGESAQAEQMVQKALDINPLALSPLFEKFLQTGKRPTSVRPDPQYDLEAALDYLDLSLVEDAARILESALSLNPDKPSPILFYHLFDLNRSLGREEKAAAFLKKAQGCPPDYVFPFRIETEKVLKAALISDPSDWKAHYYLGNLLVSKFRWEEGFAHYEQAASFSPPLAVLFSCLGDISRRKQNDPLKAEEFYKHAVSLAPEQYRYYPILDELLFINGKMDARERLFLSAPAEVKKNFTVLLQQAQFYVDTEHYDLALDILRNNTFLPWEGWTGAHEVFARALLRKGDAKFRAGEYEDALRSFKESLTYPENLGTGRPHLTQTTREHYLIGLCLHRLNRRQEAEKEFMAAAADEAGMPSEDAYYRGKALEALGQKGEASSIFQTLKIRCESALEQTQEAPLFHWAALACRGLGEHKKADRYLRLATRADPSYRGAVIFGLN
ncbi:MAG: tetratricopeptide repeat protein, partial [Candidatus Aminicenantes bacterium]|nr:tetratricopeptide repeat protein [Candidatus Aminicenantes bacterium]